jgi:hypothetical protein
LLAPKSHNQLVVIIGPDRGPDQVRSVKLWRRASLLLLEEVGAAALTRQVQVALVMDGKLNPTFERMSTARRWRDA